MSTISLVGDYRSLSSGKPARWTIRDLFIPNLWQISCLSSACMLIAHSFSRLRMFHRMQTTSALADHHTTKRSYFVCKPDVSHVHPLTSSHTLESSLLGRPSVIHIYVIGAAQGQSQTPEEK